MIALGLDLLEIDRIRRSLQNPRFVERVASHILDVRRGTVLEAPTASMG